MEVKKTDRANLEKKKGLFLQLGLVMVLSIVLIAFEWTSQPDLTNTLGTESGQVSEEEMIPITRQQEVTPPPPPPPQVIEQLIVVENDVDIEDEIDIDDMEADQNTEIQIAQFEEEEEAVEQTFFIVEDMPKFQGGSYEGFRTWISQNMKYPVIAQENGISGRVFVQFAVNSKGEIVDAVVVRGVDPALDKEALRVVNSSPKWEPGKQRGRPVKVQFTFPISFVLQ